jgi:hypothetical protein
MSISKGKFRKFIRTNIGVLLPTILVCLVILEIGLRATGRKPSNVTDGFFVQHGQSYRMKTNFSKSIHTPSYSCKVFTNSFGLRDRVSGPRKIGPTPYIIFMGESLTFGNGVDYEQSFVGIFEQLAKEHGFEAVNLAVGGHGFSDQEELLRDFLASVPQMPTKVIVCFSPPLLRKVLEWSPNYIVKNGYVFEKDGWLIPYFRILLGNEFSAYCFFRDNIRRIQSRFSNVNSERMLEILDNYSINNIMKQPSSLKQIEERLKAFDTYIINSGATPIYVYLPLSNDFDLNEYRKSSGKPPEMYDFHLYDGLLEDHCGEAQIQLVDLFPILSTYYEKGEKLNFMADGHYNVIANKIIGETIYQSLF